MVCFDCAAAAVGQDPAVCGPEEKACERSHAGHCAYRSGRCGRGHRLRLNQLQCMRQARRKPATVARGGKAQAQVRARGRETRDVGCQTRWGLLFRGYSHADEERYAIPARPTISLSTQIIPVSPDRRPSGLTNIRPTRSPLSRAIEICWLGRNAAF